MKITCRELEDDFLSEIDIEVARSSSREAHKSSPITRSKKRKKYPKQDNKTQVYARKLVEGHPPLKRVKGMGKFILEMPSI
jgi:hypothetical protein